MKNRLPTIDAAKAQAKALRTALLADGRPVTHMQALELVAKSHGLHDWNTLLAKIGNAPPPPMALGDLVEGDYLKQPFLGEVVGLQALSGARYEVTLQLDTAVDVVTFDSFSNFRSRIRKIITADGRSEDRTSDGVPHLVLRL